MGFYRTLGIKDLPHKLSANVRCVSSPFWDFFFVSFFLGVVDKAGFQSVCTSQRETQVTYKRGKKHISGPQVVLAPVRWSRWINTGTPTARISAELHGHARTSTFHVKNS